MLEGRTIENMSEETIERLHAITAAKICSDIVMDKLYTIKTTSPEKLEEESNMILGRIKRKINK